MLGCHFWVTFLWYVCITWNNVTATFRFCLLLGRNFIAYFILLHNFTYLFEWFHFLMMSELRWIIEIVKMCELRMEVTLWNSHILVAFFFFELTNFLKMLIFLIMLRLRLLWYVCIKYEDVTITFHICSV